MKKREKFSKKRTLTLDIGKALCIILVVIGHYWPVNCPAWHQSLRDVIYIFHMPFFLFASGYIYIHYKKEEPYLIFIKRKVIRLLIPYFVVSFLIVVIKLLSQKVGAYVESPVTLNSFIRIFYTNEAGYFVWFIWSLFTIFLICPFFKTKKSRLVLLFVSMLLYYLPVSFENCNVFCIEQTRQMFMYFMLGVAMSDFPYLIEKLKSLPFFVVPVLFISLLLFRFVFELDFLLFPVILAIMGIWSVLCISRKLVVTKLKLPWLYAVSAASYFIYLLHTMFMGFAKAVLNKLPMFVNPGNLGGYLTGYVIIVLCGVIAPMLVYSVKGTLRNRRQNICKEKNIPNLEQ